MRDERDSRVDPLRDVFIHAPIGALLIAKDRVESFLTDAIARGREERDAAETGIRNQVEIARSVGRARVKKAFREATERSREAPFVAVTSLAEDIAKQIGQAAVDTGRQQISEPPNSGGDGGKRIRQAQADMGLRLAQNARVAENAPSDLPIEAYDSLSAAQVRSLLPGLSRAELEAIRQYEEAHRKRKTILSGVAELLSE